MVRNRSSLGLAALAFLLLACAPRASAQKTRWVETGSWMGLGTMMTDTFLVVGDRWRVRYIPRGKGPFKIVVRDEKGAELTTVANQQQSAVRGWRTFKNDSGLRHLHVVAETASWEVVVEQSLTIVQEWQLVQWTRDSKPKLAKIGAWAGTDTDAEYELRVPSAKWSLIFACDGAGSLRVTLRDAEDNELLDTTLAGKSRNMSWVHSPGDYKLRIWARDIGWTVDAVEVVEQPGKRAGGPR